MKKSSPPQISQEIKRLLEFANIGNKRYSQGSPGELNPPTITDMLELNRKPAIPIPDFSVVDPGPKRPHNPEWPQVPIRDRTWRASPEGIFYAPRDGNLYIKKSAEAKPEWGKKLEQISERDIREFLSKGPPIPGVSKSARFNLGDIGELWEELKRALYFITIKDDQANGFLDFQIASVEEALPEERAKLARTADHRLATWVTGRFENFYLKQKELHSYLGLCRTCASFFIGSRRRPRFCGPECRARYSQWARNLKAEKGRSYRARKRRIQQRLDFPEFIEMLMKKGYEKEDAEREAAYQILENGRTLKQLKRSESW